MNKKIILLIILLIIIYNSDKVIPYFKDINRQFIKRLRKERYDEFLKRHIRSPKDPRKLYWNTDRSQMKVALVIVEPRKHEWLYPVLNNAAEFFGGGDAGLFIIHGNKNENYVKDIIGKWKGVNLVNLNVDNLTIKQYNHLLTSEDFYKLFDNIPYILVFQTDSLFFRKLPSKYLENNYDYVGALFSRSHVEGKPNRVIGNGGLSLRKVETMLEISRKYGPLPLDKNNTMNEDVFFSKYCEKFPSIEDANSFSVEHISHPSPFGHHQAYLFHRWEYMQSLLNRLL